MPMKLNIPQFKSFQLEVDGKVIDKYVTLKDVLTAGYRKGGSFKVTQIDMNGNVKLVKIVKGS